MPTRHPRQMVTLTPERSALLDEVAAAEGRRPDLGGLVEKLPRVMIDSDVEDAALVAQRELARRGHQRTASPADLLIAACAHVHGSGVLHYDRDYDILLEITGLDYESHWLAPAGAL